MSFKIKVIFLLTFVWGSLALQDLGLPFFHADCPRLNDINNLVMLPGPNCGQYYRCFNGQAYLQQCPYNLHWSPNTYRCDRPEIAQCQLASATLTITPSLPTGYPYNPYNTKPVLPSIPSMYPYNPYNPTLTTMYPYNPYNPKPVAPLYPAMYPNNMYIPNNSFGPLLLADKTPTDSK